LADGGVIETAIIWDEMGLAAKPTRLSSALQFQQ
jgi:hypothetical protein